MPSVCAIAFVERTSLYFCLVFQNFALDPKNTDNFEQIYLPIDKSLTSTTTPSLSEHGSGGNNDVLHTFQNF